MKKYLDEFKSKCRSALELGISSEENAGQSNDLEMSPVVEQSPSSEDVHKDLRRYEVPHETDGNPNWWVDVDVVRSKLLLEFATWNKVAVFNEGKACHVLTMRPPELPPKLADMPIEGLQSGDVNLEYWYWLRVTTDVVSMDQTSHCCVTLEKGKRNPSWAMPLLVIAEEVRYFLPLSDRFKRGDGGQSTCFTLGNNRRCMLDGNTRPFEFLERSYPGEYQCVVINYRIFDSVIPNRVISLCFDVLMRKLDFSLEKQENGTLKVVDAASNKKRFEMMVKFFLEIPIHVSGETEYTMAKARGIPGGSCFTRLIRTMSNFVITWILCSSVFRHTPRAYRFHGRKCVLVFDSKLELDLDEFSKRAETHFGVIVDSNRTCITASVEDFHLLGYCCDTDEYD